MLMNRNDSVLLIIDVQARLAPSIHDGDRVTANCAWLAQVADRMAIPVVVTEHCADKLGPTLDLVKDAADGAYLVPKKWFSALAEDALAATAVQNRGQIILCGMEAHVCVAQTALQLCWAGKEVFVAADACGSRDPADRDLAFARMRTHGIEIVSREMIVFEWLQRAGTDLFREINRDFIR